jgi:hypothetical protein
MVTQVLFVAITVLVGVAWAIDMYDILWRRAPRDERRWLIAYLVVLLAASALSLYYHRRCVLCAY